MISSRKCGRRSTKRLPRCKRWRPGKSPIRAKTEWLDIIGYGIPHSRPLRKFAPRSNRPSNASRHSRRIFMPEKSRLKMENSLSTCCSLALAARRSDRNSSQTLSDHGVIQWTSFFSITQIRTASTVSSTRWVMNWRRHLLWWFQNLAGQRKHETECSRRKRNSKKRDSNLTSMQWL